MCQQPRDTSRIDATHFTDEIRTNDSRTMCVQDLGCRVTLHESHSDRYEQKEDPVHTLAANFACREPALLVGTRRAFKTLMAEHTCCSTPPNVVHNHESSGSLGQRSPADVQERKAKNDNITSATAGRSATAFRETRLAACTHSDPQLKRVQTLKKSCAAGFV